MSRLQRSSRSPRSLSRSSRPAGSPTSSARCRARWRARASRVRTLVPGYPACSTELRERAGRRDRSANLFGGPARLLAGAAGTLDLLVARRPASLRPAGQPLSRTRRARLARQRPALRRALARPRPRSAAALSPAMAARRRARPRLAGRPRAGLSPLRRRTPAPGTVMTVHNIAFQGHLPGRRCCRSSACRPRPSRSTASSITARSAS